MIVGVAVGVGVGTQSGGAADVATISGTTSDTKWGTIAQHDVELTGSYPGASTAQWQQRPAGSSDPWVNVPVGGTTATFTPDIGVNCTYGYELSVVPDGDTSKRSAAYVIRYSSADFVMTFEGTDFTLPLANGTTNATLYVDGDAGTAITTYNDAALALTGLSAGTHILRMTGQAHGIFFDGGGDAAKVRTVETFGNLSWQTMFSAFDGCSGMTSWAAGNPNVITGGNWYTAWRGCSSMVTCDLTNMSFVNCTNLQSTWAGCLVLENLDFTIVSDTGAKPVKADECFYGSPAGPPLDDLDPSGLDITGITSPGGFGGGFFNFLNNRNLTTAIYDDLLVNWAAQLPIDVPFVLEPDGDGVICDFQMSQPTMGGAVETARTALINAGFFMEDAETTDPDQMAAPGLTVDSDTEITITRSARPFSGGLPIRFYDYRYSTDEATWTEVLGTQDDFWTTKQITGLSDNRLYYVQVRARGPAGTGYEGAWSPSQTATTEESATASMSVEEIGSEPVITSTGQDPSDTIEITIGTGTYAGTYSTDVRDSSTITVSEVESAPVPFVKPDITGTPNAGEVQTGVPPLYIYDGADLGDITYEWYEDGVATGDTDLSYTPSTALSSPGLVLRASYGGVTVDSDAVVIGAALTDAALMENGVDTLLLETGDRLLLET